MRVTTKLNKSRRKVRNKWQVISQTKQFWSRLTGKFPVKQTGLSKKELVLLADLEINTLLSRK